jgi:hypothetical protein
VSNVTPIKKTAREAAVWLSPAQVCERVPGMTEEILQHLRKNRQGPAFYKPTLKTTLYLESEIDAWVARSRVQTREQKP